MRVFERRQFAILSLGCLCACGGAQSQAHGTATYAAPASQGGQAVVPQQQSSDLQLTIAVGGAGTFQAVQNAACNLTNGDLTETTTTSGQVSAAGAYQGDFDVHQSGSTWSNTLCGTVQNVKLSSVTSLTVKATVPTNPANCQAYCNATASVQCQGSVDPNCVTSTSSSCSATCASSQKITAQGSLQQSDLATTNSELSSTGQVDAKVDLVFTALE